MSSYAKIYELLILFTIIQSPDMISGLPGHLLKGYLVLFLLRVKWSGSEDDHSPHTAMRLQKKYSNNLP